MQPGVVHCLPQGLLAPGCRSCWRSLGFPVIFTGLLLRDRRRQGPQSLHLQSAGAVPAEVPDHLRQFRGSCQPESPFVVLLYRCIGVLVHRSNGDLVQWQLTTQPALIYRPGRAGDGVSLVPASTAVARRDGSYPSVHRQGPCSSRSGATAPRWAAVLPIVPRSKVGYCHSLTSTSMVVLRAVAIRDKAAADPAFRPRSISDK